MIRLRYAHLTIVLRPLAANPLATAHVWHRRLQLRHELSRLDDSQMRDTGLDPAVVRREAEKPFWRA
jgi:uncharacterized protein YjiS (DUF1127 family)